MIRQNKIIYVDVDDTIADTRKALIDYYRIKTGDFSTNPSMKTGLMYDQLVPLWTRDKFTYAFMDPSFFEILKPIHGARLALNNLINKGYDVQICTAHREEGIELKRKWINEHFPMIKTIHFTKVLTPKDEYVGYAFIDDGAHNLVNNASTLKFLFDHYNIFEECEGAKRVFNWKEIEEVL